MRAAVLVLLVLATATTTAGPWTWKQSGEYLHDVEVAADGSVATFARGELVRFSAAGKVVHRRAFPRTALVRAIAFAPGGDLVAVGYFEKTLDLGGSALETEERDGFVARYKPDGTLRWAAQLAGKWMAMASSVAVTTDRVLAVGSFRKAVSAGGTTLESDDDAGFALLLDADGKVLALTKRQAELAAACATIDAFVIAGRDRTTDEAVFAQGVTKDLAVRWSYAGSRGEVTGVACRATGTSFVASHAQNETDFTDDVAVLELDDRGALARTIPIATPARDLPLSIAATAKELVVTTRHSGDNSPVASRVTRFGAKGAPLSVETYQAAETVWVRAAYKGSALVLAGEVQQGAKLSVRGTALTGPVVFVSSP